MNQPNLIQPDQPIDSIEEYKFEPIKGYPMLNWRGKRPFSATQYFPAQHKETHGPEVDAWRNKIYWGDNLQVMSHLLKEYRGQVKLVYIDPPFDSKADYKKKIKLQSNTISNEHNAFEDKQYTDIWTNDEYLQFMYERLVLSRELLSPDGCIYLHCDYHKSHQLRCLLDEIFGADRILNEIIWKRTSARSDSKTFNHIHDTVFLYSKGPIYSFNKLYLPHDPSYIDRYFTYTESDERRFATIDATQAGLRNGSSGMAWRGFSPASKGNHWKFTVEKLEELDKLGRIYWPQKEGGWPRLKSYLDEVKGSMIQSIWSDIKAVNSQAKERGDYPTQKPETLLERIISASSNPGDLVFDCFMGSGTTQAVAMKLGRRFIGADINLGAVQITTKRLISIGNELSQQTTQPTQPALALDQEANNENDGPAQPTTFYTGFDVYNVNHYDIFRNPVEARDLLLEALEVNLLAASHLFDGEKDGRMIKLMPVNQIATKANLNDLLANLDYSAFQRRKAEHPNQPVEKITLVCMGHEPDLAATLKLEVKKNGFDVDVEVVDILRDKQELQFKYEAEADVNLRDGQLIIDAFYPMNLLNKLSLQADNVEEWRELVESVMIDWNYDGAILQPALVDIPPKNELVQGTYPVPEDAGTIRIKITDLLSESLEIEVAHG